MAVGTEKISSFTATKIARSFPVNACPPVSIEVPMTFAAETVALCKIDELPVVKPEFIPVLCIMTIEAPHHYRMMELDIRMFVLKLPFLEIRFNGGMAVAARKHPLCNRRWSNRELLSPLGRRYKINCQEEGEPDRTNFFLHAY